MTKQFSYVILSNMDKKPIFIAEIKTKSMFGFESKYSRNTLIDTALNYGDWISVHTDPRFGGSFDDIYLLRKETKKPILAKGFHAHNDDVRKALDLGADYVLVVDRYIFGEHDLSKHVIYEVSNLNDDKFAWGEIIKASNNYKYCYNGRNLRTGIGKKYIGDYQQYRGKCKWLCGASLINKPEDVQTYYKDCDAFIVGENLVQFCKEYKNII